MKCSACESRLAAYLEGEASPADARVVEEHLKDCAACRELAGAMRSVELRLAGLQGIEPRADFTQAVMSSVAVLPVPKPARMRMRWFVGYLAAAWAALIALTASHVIDWQRLFAGAAVQLGKVGAAATTIADVGARLHLTTFVGVALGVEMLVLLAGALVLRRYVAQFSGWLAGAQAI